jgi:hypothetical protein
MNIAELKQGCTVLKLACPERVVFVLDMRCGNSRGEQFKLAASTFVKMKSAMDARHEFALVAVCGDCPVWLCDFTRDASAFSDKVAALQADHQASNAQFDLTSVLQLVHTNGVASALEPEIKEHLGHSPSFVLRLVLVYGQSATVPLLDSNCPIVADLMAARHFFLDAVFVHDKPTLDNCPQEIFDFLTSELQTVNHSLSLFVETSVERKIGQLVMSLISHPLLRLSQSDQQAWPTSLIHQGEE